MLENIGRTSRKFSLTTTPSTIQKARTIELCAKLKPLKLTWSCTSRVTTDFETLKAMKEAGCRLLIVGYESGDEQILRTSRKAPRSSMARRFTKDCHKLGLIIHGDFISDCPEKLAKRMSNTIAFAKDSTPKLFRSRSRTLIPEPNSTVSPRKMR